MRCRHECECPSQLWHDLHAVVAEYNAPVVQRPTSYYIALVADALSNDRARSEEEPAESAA